MSEIKTAQPLQIAGIEINRGESKSLQLPTIRLYTGGETNIPVYVKRGKNPGPTLFVSAAIHGDELNGVEIISRLINSRTMRNLRGTLIAVPTVNIYGVINQSRYLPDRRDLNRSFPGSKRGSLAARLAHLFFTEVVEKCNYGIDLHTGAKHRSNLPQIRANLDDSETLALARAFGVPVLINANTPDGSLRESAAGRGVKMLLFEGGEALRFDELSIRVGLRGIINVMRYLGMLKERRSSKSTVIEPYVARESGWVRATDSGIVKHLKALGDYVKKDELLANIADPLGQLIASVYSPTDGVIIGKQNIPLVQEGEAMYHIAYFKKPDGVIENIELMQDHLIPDEDES